MSGEGLVEEMIVQQGGASVLTSWASVSLPSESDSLFKTQIWVHGAGGLWPPGSWGHSPHHGKDIAGANSLWQFLGMRLPIFLLTCSMGFAGSAPAAEPIYSPVQPEVFHVWTRVADFSPRLRAVEAAELSPAGRLAASGSKFGYKVMLWRVADGILVWEAEHESEVECVVFSPDGLRPASGGEDFFVRVWDVKSGEAIAAWEHPSRLDGITWSNQGHLIATGAENGDLFPRGDLK